MNTLNNPSNVKGMAEIYADDDEDLDIDSLEKSIITGVAPQKKANDIDLAGEYSKELEGLSKKFGINTKAAPSAGFDFSSYNAGSSAEAAVGGTSSLDDTAAELDKMLSWTPGDDATEEDSGEDINVNSMGGANSASNGMGNAQSSGQRKQAPWTLDSIQDPQLTRMTMEERKQSHINKVLGGIDKVNDEAEFLNQEDEEDEMARIIEQIDLLRGNLESEGVDLSRIPDISSTSSKKEAKSVLRILQIKNDRLRYCDFFEEGILAVAYGLESVFNGKREILGTKIDLTGYYDTVKVKLRRMRYDTSNFVSSIMQGYNISSGWRIALELIPSLFLYSRDRKIKAKDNLISDDSYKKAMQDLQGTTN
jgi:hypothetical protein